MGTPIHPLLVHFPIALLIFGVIFQFVALWKKEFFNKMALYLFGSGFVMGIASYMTGDSAIPDAREKWGQAVHSMVETHEHYALITMAIFGAVLFFKLLARFKPYKWIMPLVLVLCIAGTTTLALTGHYGGKMVYNMPGETSAPAK
ncbi:DUF2231 domain-containing protein [Heyndrickxia coagulans]|jgi:uncharacterized membrane protein|uniref:DUF2231 domain-containing protein n=2 Tax=Heyndrickxia coagulans TaxID=1398 RepID=G2TIW3_HEYCO|nr:MULTISPECIES: DUF2231 domain-containing protein [Heyndrickxia]AEH54933.1 membrane protein-like protein [Heyndrickxia coagulans 2-6]AEP00586.1 hypothetical protein Bcoa_1380 [Heyndrickxia coagulans 36D1]KYC67070.1 hypothetical protein B4098_1274 [Heyndrickxia coagulans]MBF8418136.1 DUF2231 domain-containing protein [Heyndrickxia coagulans]MEC2306389.1 DUF2231 domain-containing protein [Weizmannia sp. CD-2023]